VRLVNNQALDKYLITLATKLRERGANLGADALIAASRQAAAMSTEFLGESRIALRALCESGARVLSDEDRAELNDVLEQLDAALDRKPDVTERWIAAGKCLAKDPLERVRCPVCQNDFLVTKDLSAGPSKVERLMTCPRCGAKNFLLMRTKH